MYGAQLIKQREGFSDREVIDAARDTPAFQYFMGLPDCKPEWPFTHVTLMKFRDRIAPISELIRNVVADYTRETLQQALPEKSALITDATAMPVNIRFPQDTNLLNGARLKLELDIKLMSK